MSRIGNGLVAGLVATVVLSGLMVIKSMMGLMPQLDSPQMIAAMMGAPNQPAIGWGVHVMIGIALYGAAMALLHERLPGDSAVAHGVLIAVVGWLMMMVVLMPMAGTGMFGMNLGIMAPMMTLILHLVFGAVLGAVYGRLQQSGGGPTHAI